MKHQKPLNAESAAALATAFLDGVTTPAQEESLYAFFRTAPAGSLPQELEAMRPMFAWYEGLRPSAAKRTPFRLRFRYAAAACVAALFVAGASVVFKNTPAENQLYAQYSGSYVIRDGERINDIEMIYSTVVKAERLADSLEAVAEHEERLLDYDYDRALVETALASVSDAELKNEIKSELLESQ